MTRHLHRCHLRYPRTMDAAFNTPRYASAIELPAPKKRPILRWAVISVVALVCMLAIAGGAQ